MKNRVPKLNQKEIEALIDVVNERMTGGTDDLRDAMGLTEDDAESMMFSLETALNKLQEMDAQL